MTLDSNCLVQVLPPLGQLNISILQGYFGLQDVPILGQTPSSYSLASLATNGSFMGVVLINAPIVPGFLIGGFNPFVYQDDRRSYFVTPRPILVSTGINDPNQAAPA